MDKLNSVRIMELEALLKEKETEIAQLREELASIRKTEQQELLECLIDTDSPPEKEENTCSYKIL
jgi:hypothetical protein